MLNEEQNRLITQTGAGTSGGQVLRRYWQPAVLTEELEGERPVKAVRLLGEDLVAFRDESGHYGLIGRHCPHRGTDLCYGRLEAGGLRCPFHGWLLDAKGKCLEQPAEPSGSVFHEKIRHTAYPCEERNGIVFAYLGVGDPPLLPELDCFSAPGEFTFAFKGFLECNWLQAVEVGIDPAHASFLHRFFVDEDATEGYGQQFRDNTSGAALPITKVLRKFPKPQIDVESTAYGLRLITRRELNASQTHIRVTNLLFPQAIVIPMSNDMTITQWHVPVDDTHSYWYAIFTAFNTPVDHATMREQRLELYSLPDYLPRLNKTNRYGYDPKEQRELTYTGMGRDINVHDQWAVESPGPIQDRTTEQLGTTDKAIIANRKLLLQAINAVGNGQGIPEAIPRPDAMVSKGPPTVDTVGPSAAWASYWATVDADRRECSAWAGKHTWP